MMNKRVDLLVLGATGFTGKCVVQHLAVLCKEEKFSWAISGRSKEKLNELIVTFDKDTDTSNILCLKADILDELSLKKALQQAKIVINCTGANTVLSAPVLKACIEVGTHYLDISAEIYAILDNYQLYHKAAKEAEILAVPACGFSVIPAVAGIIYLQKHFQGTLHSVTCYAELELPPSSGLLGVAGPLLNSGTWTSLVYVLEKFKDYLALKRKLFPEPIEPLPREMQKKFFHRHNSRFWFPYPGVENDSINISERYLHDNTAKKFVHFKAYSTVPRLIHFFIVFGMILYYYLSTFKCFRKLLINWPRLMTFGFVSPNGPTEQIRLDTKYNFVLNGKGWGLHDDMTLEPTKTLSVKVSGSDPGYKTTAVAITTCALIILKERSNTPKGGVIMPGAAFHTTNIVERLAKDGCLIEILTNQEKLDSSAK